MTAVLVTRPATPADSLVAELRARGYEVHAVPTVATRPLDVEWPDLTAYDWVVLTSAIGVETLPRIPAGPRWAAVGEATARALRAKGADVGLVPDDATGLAIARDLDGAAGARILLVRASMAAPDLPAELRRRGAQVEEVTAYETVEGPPESAPALRDALSHGGVTLVIFASGSAVRGYLRLGGDRSLPAVTIGPRTTAVAREHGLTVVAEAAGARVRELADAVERAAPVEDGSDA